MERFWSKVAKGDGCWEWQAAYFRLAGKGTKRYGMFSLGGKLRPAHRVAWELTNGPIPDGLFVLHTCDNQGCVRPDHLYLGTHADNTRDAMERQRMASGDRCWNHKLSATDVRAIRMLAGKNIPTERIGPHFGVSGRTIRYVLNGKRWAHIK